MMISPETYVKLELEGLSNDEIISKIRGLKREMARLKREAEYVGLEDDEPVIICPSPEVRIMMQREYIEAARKFLEEQGGDLPLTKEEIKAREFDENLKYVKKICVGKKEARGIGSEYFSFSNDDERVVVDHFVLKVLSEDELNKMNSGEQFDGLKWSELLDELSFLHIGDWKPHYEPKDVVVNDGVTWEVTFEYSNGLRKRKFVCDNKFPFNFDRFLEIMGIENGEE